MTRHGKNQNTNPVYSYSERQKDKKQSNFGTLHERLGADSIKEFDCCSLTLQPCREPVVTPDGYIFDKESILEYILQQKKENTKRLKLWEIQRKKEEAAEEEQAKAEEEVKAKKFKATEGTPAHPGVPNPIPEETDHASTSSLCFKRKNKSFWVPELSETAESDKITGKPSQKVLCPMSKKPLKLKDLMSVKFTPIVNDDDGTKIYAKKIRYMDPITHDVLTNTTPCSFLKTSGNIHTMECVEQIIKKDWLDPLTGKTVTEDDIIPLQRGGTGFAATNKGQLNAKLHRPQQQVA